MPEGEENVCEVIREASGEKSDRWQLRFRPAANWLKENVFVLFGLP